MKVEGYEEISERDYYGLPEFEGLQVLDNSNKKFHYFKKAQKFPIDFKIREKHEINVKDNGQMNFRYFGDVVLNSNP